MPLSGLNVLLAEDNPTNQLVAMQMLESLGANVTLAVDGAQALEILNEQSFDLALIDIEMPRISGIDLMKTVRNMAGPVAQMPLVALTAYVMREHRLAIDDAGADGIIAKPIVSIEEFGREIAAFVQRRRVITRAAAPTPMRTANSIDEATFTALRASFDEATFAELLEKLLADVGSAAERIGAGLETEDIAELRAASHILISVAGSVGAFRLQDLSQCLNSAGHAADSSEIERVGPELLKEAERVLMFVRSAQGD